MTRVENRADLTREAQWMLAGLAVLANAVVCGVAVKRGRALLRR